MSRRILALIAVLALALAILTGLAVRKGVLGPQPQTAAVGGPFQLVDTNGRTVDQSVLKGKWSVVFFGFTQCPDVCPTAMAELAETKKQLGADGDKLQGLFVTIDPERDTAEVLKAYMGNFDPGFLALRGSLDETAQVARHFKVFYKKVQGKTAGAYTMDHSAGSFVFDPQGRIRLYTRHAAGPQALAHDVRLLLKP